MATKVMPDYIRIINLRDEYNEELIEYFHHHIMKKFFPIPDELDPVAVWINNMRPQNRDKPSHQLLPEMNICVAFDTRVQEEHNPQYQKIVAAIVFEYYRLSGCALLSYFMVDESYRELGMGKHMVNHSYNVLQIVGSRYKESGFVDRILEERLNNISSFEERLYFSQVQKLLNETGKPQFSTYFAETNAWDVDDGVMVAEKRHQIMRRIGFKMLDFDYLQLPLSEEQEPCSDLILLAYDVPDLPTDSENNNRRYVPTQLVRVFLYEFGYSVFESFTFVNQDYFQFIENDLHNRGARLYLSGDDDIPWKRRTNYQVSNSSPSSNSLQSRL